MPRRGRILRLLGLFLVLLVGLSFLPPVRLRIHAGLAVLRAVGVPVPGIFGAAVTERWVTLEPGLSGDLFVPLRPAPAIVLIHGAAPRGARDPRILRLAHALAETDRVVFVPQLDLRHRVFVWADIRRLERSVIDLSRQPFVHGSVGELGISYGGSFGLVAAAQPAIRTRVAYVADFGSYLDIRHVVQGITTHATIVDGNVEPWTPASQAFGILRHIAQRFLSQADQAALDAALSGTLSPGALSAPARAEYDVLENRDPRRALALVDRLPAPLVAELRRFSPSNYVGRVEAPVAVMRSRLDPAVPPTEGELLARAFHAPLYTLRSFTHVTPGSIVTGLPDLWRASSFTAWILSRG